MNVNDFKEILSKVDGELEIKTVEGENILGVYIGKDALGDISVMVEVE